MKFNTLTTLEDRSFAVAAPQLWNSLQLLIASFKTTLKTFLFQKAFWYFYVLFNPVFTFLISFYCLKFIGFMKFLYDLSADENGNIDIGAIYVL